MAHGQETGSGKPALRQALPARGLELDLIFGLPSGPAAWNAPQQRPHTCQHPTTRCTNPEDFSCSSRGVHTCRIKKLDRQSWLADLKFESRQVSIRVAAEAGAQGPGMAPVIETLAECGPSLAADPTQLARGGWAQPRRRGRDQAHLTTEHGGRGGRLAPACPALVVALRAEQMLEVVVGARQAGYRVTMEQPGFVAAGHLAEVPDGVGERPRLSAVPVHGGDEPVEAAPDKA